MYNIITQQIKIHIDGMRVLKDLIYFNEVVLPSYASLGTIVYEIYG